MKKLFILLMSITMAVFASADPVTPAAALQKAAKFLNQGKARRLKGKSVAITQAHAMTPPAKLSTTSDPVFYTFNIADNNGFVIVSGDDAVPDILGYCDKGRFDIDSIPCNMRFWMDACAERIAIARKLGVKASSLSASGTTPIGRTDIPTLIDVNWDQGEPYNDQCIFDGKSCLTGCVATAMAQIAYYWGKGKSGRHFEHGSTAIEGYEDWNDNNIPAIGGIESFDWDAMTMNEYGQPNTNASKAAVAQLMRYCGQAVQMNYNIGSSAAYTTDALDAFKNHFEYAGDIDVSYDYDCKNDSTWNDIFYDNLKKGYPLLLGGAQGEIDSNGHLSPFDTGHAFICDGYNASNNTFHINWGWGGSCNGYFWLDYLDPVYSASDWTLEELIEMKSPTGDDGIALDFPVPYYVTEVVTGLSPWLAYSKSTDNKATYYYDNMADTREGETYDLKKRHNKVTKVIIDESFSEYGSMDFQTISDISFCDLEKVEEYEGLENLNTQNMNDMAYFFFDNYSLKHLDLSSFNTSNVINMSSMFKFCTKLEDIDLHTFDTSNVTDMGKMFSYCISIKNLDLSSFKTSKVTNMNEMFVNCWALKSLDLSGFYIGENINTSKMLYNLRLDSLAISSTMYRLADDACLYMGSKKSPVTIYAPEGFDFGTETDGPYFVWKSGYFRLPGSYVLGDVNHDGFVSILDVTLSIDYTLGNKPNVFHTKNADLNEDGFISVSDVTQIINIILQKK